MKNQKVIYFAIALFQFLYNLHSIHEGIFLLLLNMYVLTICINFIMKEVAKYFSKLNYDISLLFLLKWYTVFVFIVLFPIF